MALYFSKHESYLARYSILTVCQTGIFAVRGEVLLRAISRSFGFIRAKLKNWEPSAHMIDIFKLNPREISIYNFTAIYTSLSAF